MSLAGSLLFALADGHGDAVFAEDGGDLQVSAERFDVGAQGGKVDLAAALQPGDAALGDAELGGELDLGDVAGRGKGTK